MAYQSHSSSKSRRLCINQTWVKQKGAVLIFIAFILGLGAAVYVLKTYNADAARARQDEKTYKALNDAKVALIAWAVSHPNTPGLMPYPDRNGDGNYDDTSDCYASNVNFAPSFTIGRLPLFKSDPNCVNAKNTVTSGLAGDFRDGSGERLWYEVSQNLLHDYKNNGDPAGTSPIINPSIVNTPTNGWFVVVDRSGKVLSDRVAAVIIAPGAPVGDQDRSSGIADANQYLDKIVMASGKTYKNYTYYDSAIPLLKQEFIVGDDLRLVSKDDPTYKNQTVEPYYFNDKLIYITIDELIAALSSRAAAEAKAQLLNYKKATDLSTPLILNDGYYPFASALVATEHYQGNNQLAGFLPTQQPTQTTLKSCAVSYTSASSSFSTCDSFSIDSVDFTRTTGTFTSVTGTQCTLTNSNKTCNCNITTGSSRCNGTAGRRFTCTTTGCATAGTLPGNYVFNGVFKFSAAPSHVKVNKESGVCTGCGSNTVTCSSASAATGNFAYDVTTTPAVFNSAVTGSTLPAWFTSNAWQNYLFYSVASNCVVGQLCNTPDINVGSRTGVQAMLATVGSPIVSTPFSIKGSAQTQLGCDVKEYLDSTENTNLDTTFESNTKQRKSNYNDQTYVVSP
ncbi:hypothetical protein [Methylotenera sp.]|uniref:hypothetical protein n=1 Tax=Methylotenera sp. TaxID=2051956 RepID=UPI0024884D16|nr:hypothetical protein [Methylotenera sp.]MDI1363167.1 hypothetical protein [Methylotenera sp.]